MRQPPWTVSYGDGSGNVTTFSQAAGDAEVRFEYAPVTPAQSSSGTYSGGEPRDARLPASDPRIDELWRRVDELQAQTALRAGARAMGTGSFRITSAAGRRDFLVRSSPELGDFDAFVARFRR